MTDTEYQDRAEQLLQAVELACDVINDASDADIDLNRVGGVLTMTFPNRTQIVVNLQKPLHEVWLASKEGGYHYRWSESQMQWMDTKGQGEFFMMLSHAASLHAGSPLHFSL